MDSVLPPLDFHATPSRYRTVSANILPKKSNMNFSLCELARYASGAESELTMVGIIRTLYFEQMPAACPVLYAVFRAETDDTVLQKELITLEARIKNSQGKTICETAQTRPPLPSPSHPQLGNTLHAIAPLLDVRFTQPGIHTLEVSVNDHRETKMFPVVTYDLVTATPHLKQQTSHG